MQGEPVERVELEGRFNNLVRNWTALVARQTKLVSFIGGYAQASTVVPVLINSPAYLAGAIPLGTLMQSAFAFQRVEGSFAFCLSAYSKLAEWKAVLDRLAQFKQAMAEVDAHHARHEGTIAVAPGAGSDLDVSGLTLRLPDGTPIVDDLQLDLAGGDRLAVTGASGSGKSTLFRGLAGLWPNGSGRVVLPRDADMLVMPQRPYFPLGTLRQAIAYPRPAAEVSDAALREALAATGLAHLAERLDEEADWSVLLSGGEQQRMAVARVLLRRPDVLMFDEPVAALSDAVGHELYAMLMAQMPQAIILTIDRRGTLRDLHGKVIEMARSDAPPTRPAAAAAAVPA